MKTLWWVVCLVVVVLVTADGRQQQQASPQSQQSKKERSMEYIPLLNTLLQQTNVLSSVDGALLAFTTVLASLIAKARPFLIASALSYAAYVGAALVLPGPMSGIGLPTMSQTMGRSAGDSKPLLAESFLKSIQISPVMSVVTNVSVNVITEAVSRLRMASRIALQQLTVLQAKVALWGRMLSNECVARFLCRVGQFTQLNFPTASAVLRSLGDTYPNMDEFAVAVIRGTSSSNCSLIYPDCTV